MKGWRKPAILEPASREEAISHLKAYFAQDSRFEGKFFNTFLADMPQSDPNVISAEDLLALTMLSVGFKDDAPTVLRLMVDDASKISELLAKIPADADIRNPIDRERFLVAQPLPHGDGECETPPTYCLWRFLRKFRGMGPVRTSKLMARKRPHLIPIFDRQVAQRFGVKSSDGQWDYFASLFADGDFIAHLADLRTAAGLDESVPLLRVLDVTVWMSSE